jgi:hypothetical protein
MKDNRDLAPWIKCFLLEYLPTDRNFARNTQHSIVTRYGCSSSSPARRYTANPMSCWWRISMLIW